MFEEQSGPKGPQYRNAEKVVRELAMEVPVIRETMESLPASRRPSSIVNEATQLATYGTMAREVKDGR
jgi:hypothetical protein